MSNNDNNCRSKPNASGEELHISTRLIRAGLNRSESKETSEAIYLSSGFVYDTCEEAEAAFDGTQPRYVYGRVGSPTVTMFEQRLAAAEGAKICHATASGMAAIQGAIMGLISSGDRIVVAKALFTSSRWILTDYLPRLGVHVDYVDGTDLDQWADALSTPAKLVLLESPTNPAMDVIDIQAVCDLAHKAEAKVIIDNVFATPLLQKPLELGADIVVYSATKHIDGQGRCLGGAILCNDPQWAEETYGVFLRHTGPCLSPFNAWNLLKGLETLDLRVQRACSTAQAVAEFLETCPEIENVAYPGLKSHPQHELAMRQMSGSGGPMLSFTVKGGKEAAFKLANNLKIIDICNNLGDSKTLIAHPATSTHQSRPEAERLEAGITPGLMRVSIGLEHPDDLIADFKQALAS